MAKKKPIAVEEQFEEKILARPLSKAIPEFMMPYAEYIILERALPRVEDGLKPVQRRILYTMHDLGMKPDGPYKKSARVVGDCLGKYHPHGDISIYEAMVKMAQEFNMRNTLVNGHGNFGSIDGDGAAAMRYTEVKLEKLACELLRDLEKDTVKWVKNFDDSLMEPDLLPGRFPNLLVNGSMGIAIGLATNIPTHNLTEVIDGTIAYIDNPRISVKDMLKIIKGPDFPTGGFVIPGDSLEEIYTTGRGKIIMRARAEIENSSGGKQSIIITEIPYGVNKSKLQQRILDIKKEEDEKNKNTSVLSGVTEITDESDRNGIRVVIQLKKGADAVKILNYLYKKTDLQCNFGVNMVAIADGRPQQLGLLDILKYYVRHQREVVLKRSQFDLNNAKRREHILDGYAIVLPDIDTVVQIIKESNSRSEARDKLRAHFGLSEKQADAILDLRLVNITKMEAGKIRKERDEIKVTIARLEKIVSSQAEQLRVVKKELTEIRDQYKTDRLSRIVENIDDIEQKPYSIETTDTKRGYVVLDAEGKIKFLNPRQYILADRLRPSMLKETSVSLTYCDAGKKIVVFSSHGNGYVLNVNSMRESTWKDEGEALNHIFPSADKDERAVSVIDISQATADKELIFYTEQGMVKRSPATEYVVNKESYQAMVLKDDDRVINVEYKRDYSNIVSVSDDGQCLNTPLDEYPIQGRKAGGVIGISLSDGAKVKWAGQIDTEEGDIIGEILLISDGYAKRVVACTIEVSKRARKGSKVIDLTGRHLLYAGGVTDEAVVVMVDKNGIVNTVSSEDILIDRNRLGKGKPLPTSVGCKYVIKQIGDC